MEKHTPGPWSVFVGKTNCGCEGAYGAVYADAYALATVWADVEEIEKEAEANARLMSAAPELLSLLIELRDSSYAAAVREDYENRVEAAIAKAEGTR